MAGNPPQTGGLHEAFGDLTAIFLALSQLDQCEAVVAQTKARLHDKTFLADIAEQFGLALGSTTGLRNADNDLTLSQACTEVHAISQVFTGAVYDILADVFALERNPALEDCASVLHRVAGWLRGLVLRALIAAPDAAATYADVANEMLRLAAESDLPGHEVFYAAQPDNSAGLPLADLVRRHHGDAIPLREVDRPDAAGIATAKAQRLLGWKPTRSWRDYLDETGAIRSR